jgi:hypothetical protein
MERTRIEDVGCLSLLLQVDRPVLPMSRLTFFIYFIEAKLSMNNMTVMLKIKNQTIKDPAGLFFVW